MVIANGLWVVYLVDAILCNIQANYPVMTVNF